MITVRSLRCLLVVMVVAGGVAFAPMQVTRAATFVVDNPFDTPDADLTDGICLAAFGGGCTLRAAIQQANRLGGSHSIGFAAGGTYQLTRVGADTEAAFGDLDIASGTNITITGAGTTTTIDAAPLADEIFRIFSGGSLTLRNLILTGGSPGASSGKAGAITNAGTLTLDAVTVSDNQAVNCGGIANAGGTATIIASTLTNNRATGSGGALCNGLTGSGGTLTIANSAINSNRLVVQAGSAGFGAGLFNASGTTTVSGSAITRNSAITDPGAIFALGGGIAANAGSVTLTNSTIADNVAVDGAGGMIAYGGAITLGALGLYGGRTETRPLLAPSAAIDAIPAPGNGSPPADQRGITRPQGTGFDIGAFEYVPPIPLPDAHPTLPSRPPPAPIPAARPTAAPSGPPAPLPNPHS